MRKFATRFLDEVQENAAEKKIEAVEVYRSSKAGTTTVVIHFMRQGQWDTLLKLRMTFDVSIIRHTIHGLRNKRGEPDTNGETRYGDGAGIVELLRAIKAQLPE